MLTEPTTLAVVCPNCDHALATLSASSATILTIQCAQCACSWSVELDGLPTDVRVAVQIAILARDQADTSGQ